MQLFGTMGEKFFQCPGTKGQQDKLKILPVDGTGRDGQGQPKFGPGLGTKQDRAEKDVLKQKNDILKQKLMFYKRKGCSKTEE